MNTRKVIVPFLLVMVAMALTSKGYQKYHGVGHGVPKLNYDSLFDAATPLNESTEGQSLVENCLEAYGGVPTLKKLQSFHVTYQMVSSLGGDTVEVHKYYSRDRRYRITRQGDKGAETRSLAGSEAWFQGRDTLAALSDARYRAELYSYLALSMPLAIKTEPFSEIRYGRRAEDSLAYIYMLKPDSLMIVVGIDPEGHMIRTTEGVIFMPSTPMVFINKVSDFQSAEGYIFPSSITYISLGLEVARSKVTEIEINPAFGKEVFLLTDE